MPVQVVVEGHEVEREASALQARWAERPAVRQHHYRGEPSHEDHGEELDPGCRVEWLADQLAPEKIGGGGSCKCGRRGDLRQRGRPKGSPWTDSSSLRNVRL